MFEQQLYAAIKRYKCCTARSLFSLHCLPPFLELEGVEGCNSAFQQKGQIMIVLLAVGIFVGIILGLRFKALVLVPTLLVAVGLVAMMGIAEGHHLRAILLTVFGLVVSLQVGYVAGCVSQHPSTVARQRSTAEPVRY
jgi:hypothetical protein